MYQNNLINLISNLAEQVRLLISRSAETQRAVQRIQQGQQDQPIQTDPVKVELSHVVANAPVTDLIYYSELLKVKTLVEEDFFRCSLPEEKWKDIIYSCPKVSAPDIHTPPRLNDTTLTDRFLHLSKDDKEFEVRLLLVDATSNITQLRIELVYKTMDLPGRAPKLAEETNDSLFEPEQFDTAAYGNAPAPAQNFQQTATHNTNVWAKLTDNLWVRKIVERGFNISFNPTYSPKFNVQKKVKNGSLKFYSNIFTIPKKTGDLRLNNQEERLHDIFESRESVSTHNYTLKLQKIPEVYVKRDEPTVQSSPIRAITEPTHIQQNFEAHINTGKKKREVIENYRTINLTLMNDNQFKINTFKDTLKQDLELETRSCKAIENMQENSKSNSQFYCQSLSNICCTFTRPSNATLTSEIKVKDISKTRSWNCTEKITISDYEKKIHNGTYQLQKLLSILYALKLPQRHTRNRNKRTPAPIKEMEEPVLLTTMQLNHSSITESDTRENNINYNNSFLDFGDMVCNTEQASKIRSGKDKSVWDSVRLEKLKITTNQEKDMIFNSMKNQRSPYKKKILVERKLKNSSIDAYKLALLQLVTNKEILEKKCFNKIMDYLNDTSIISANNKYFNIGKVMGYFNIHIIGFLKESNIPRIDGACMEVLEHSLKLIIVATKEKKRGVNLQGRFVQDIRQQQEFNCKSSFQKF
ncbi:hypothetical protein BB561_005041 [Smittium simulii]|uniref:Uncharacterized protein n=1 Tax=Smittium simulii TaxID=133385 RepID=A0A2T9YCN4_9FUNG|nr:hypothetical protein BB561_005041 [Smittium simulii]